MGVESATTPRNVLIPTDGSPLSADALEQAITTFPDGDIMLIYVDDSRYTARDNDELRPERVFATLLDIAERYDSEADTEIRVGPPSREIVRFSADADVDEIMIGSHGRERLSRIPLGSVAEGVLR